MPGYREEPGVAPDSLTETYVAAKLYVDNWRWADTPFYVRAGKRLARRETTIAIEFKRAPHPPFESADDGGPAPERARRPHPAGRGRLARVRGQGAGPGDDAAHRPHGLPLRRRRSARGSPRPTSGCILDCLLGDATLFTRADEVEEQWSLVDAIVAPWKRDRPSFPNYAAGTWGPAAADELMRRDGREWRRR